MTQSNFTVFLQCIAQKIYVLFIIQEQKNLSLLSSIIYKCKSLGEIDNLCH